MSRIEAIVSDFGGVLTTPLLDAFLGLQERRGIPLEAFGAARARAPEQDAGVNPLFELEKGNVSEAAFLEAIADELAPAVGHRPEMHRFSEIYFEALEPNPPMFDLMRELKADGYRMALLTNNVREWEPLWRSMLPVDEVFELVVDSAFVRCRKPDPEIYEITLQQLGLAAERCLFIDDVEANCEGARALGIEAVHFRDNEQAIPEIRERLATAVS